MEHLPKLARFSSKMVLQILPSVSATVIGGYLLAQIHVGQSADPPPPQIVITPAAAPAPGPETPTAREERAAMRKVLKQRRENPEPPEVVHPVATAQPAAPVAQSAAPAAQPAPPATATTASVSPPPAMDSIAHNEPVERAAAPSRSKPVAAAPPRRDVERPDAATDYVPAPPPGLPVASGTAANTPTAIVPPAVTSPPVASIQPTAPAPVAPMQPIAPMQPVATVQPIAPAPVGAAQPATPAAPQVASAPDEPPAPHGPVGAVFSTLSSVIGHAANATGKTVNWVIDLPGKAISAGDRVINGPSPPPPPARLGDEG